MAKKQKPSESRSSLRCTAIHKDARQRGMKAAHTKQHKQRPFITAKTPISLLHMPLRFFIPSSVRELR